MIAPTSFFADYGCHVRILEEARALLGCGHQVTICTYEKGRDLSGIPVQRTMRLPWRADYEVGSSRHKIAFDALLLGRTVRAMFQVKPDIIHAHLHEGALIGQLLSHLWRVPMVFDFQGSLCSEMVDHHFLAPHGPLYRAMHHLELAIDHWAPRILTSTAQAVDLLVDAFGCDPSRVRCIPDCVSTEVFCPQPRDEQWHKRRALWRIPPTKRVIVYLGLLAEYQGTSHLLRAVAQILAHRSDVHLLMGGYPNIELYTRMAAELGIGDSVTFAGKVPYESVPGFLSLGDVAVSAKLSQTEGAGKLLNYMSMALPTVAFDTPVSRQYLGEQGIYAERGNDQDLARCLEMALNEKDRGEAKGRALRARAASSFSWDDAVQAILTTYHELLT